MIKNKKGVDHSMGTNFYLMSKSKKLIRKYFAVEDTYGVTNEEYEIVDEPYLGYRVHLNKLSIGWRPLFQKHKTINTFKELECFCHNNKGIVGIYDEYGRKYSWKQYFDRVYSHSRRKPEPYKWVYEKGPFYKDSRPTLHTVKCSEDEAEIYVPFNHRLYSETEQLARERVKVFERHWSDPEYWEDPDYPFDWSDGDFR